MPAWRPVKGAHRKSPLLAGFLIGKCQARQTAAVGPSKRRSPRGPLPPGHALDGRRARRGEARRGDSGPPSRRPIGCNVYTKALFPKNPLEQWPHIYTREKPASHTPPCPYPRTLAATGGGFRTRADHASRASLDRATARKNAAGDSPCRQADLSPAARPRGLPPSRPRRRREGQGTGPTGNGCGAAARTASSAAVYSLGVLDLAARSSPELGPAEPPFVGLTSRRTE